MKPTNAQIARSMGISAQAFSRYVKAGCPTYSAEAAHAWRAQHVRPRLTTAAATPARSEAVTRQESAADTLMRARTQEALARARRAEAELAKAEARSLDAAALLAALRSWRAAFGATAASFGLQIEQRVRAAVGDAAATSMRLRALCVGAEAELENALMLGLLEELRRHMPALAGQIDAQMKRTQ